MFHTVMEADIHSNRAKLLQGAMDAPLLRCTYSRTGHCRFLFKAGDTTICAMFGAKEGNAKQCGKWLSEPTHLTSKYKHRN